MPVTMDDIFEAYNQVQSQGLKPDTIFMHPDTYKELQQFNFKCQRVKAPLFKMSDIKPWKYSEMGPDGWPVVPPEPPVYKCRWQSIMEEEL